jgi:predicted butyrate kinase (DUF1464 family)
MRIVGIDPGTGSFDFFGMDNDKVIIDTSVAVPDVAKDPKILLETVREVFPLDLIVGPSGYGLPVTPISRMNESELDLMVPDDKSIPLYDGIRMVLRLMKQEKFPVCFTPGVIHLPTVPAYRKANKLDLGTADKVCCAALAIRDQSERLKIAPNKTSFIMVEIGFAFNACLAVQGGEIVDGKGGTSGGPGFLTMGSMDSELAIRLGKFPGTVLFTGGAKDMSRNPNLMPEQLPDYPEALNMLIESALKDAASLAAIMEKPKEVIITGRLTRIPRIIQALSEKLARFGPVQIAQRRARNAKEAAEGAYIIGEGLSQGRYQPIVNSLKLAEASGTMFDYVLVPGFTAPAGLTPSQR